MAAEEDDGKGQRNYQGVDAQAVHQVNWSGPETQTDHEHGANCKRKDEAIFEHVELVIGMHYSLLEECQIQISNEVRIDLYGITQFDEDANGVQHDFLEKHFVKEVER